MNFYIAYDIFAVLATFGLIRCGGFAFAALLKNFISHIKIRKELIITQNLLFAAC